MQDIHTSGIIVIGVGALGASFFGLSILLLLALSQKFIAEVFWFSAVMVPIVLGGCGVLVWLMLYEYGLDESGVNSETKIMLVRILGYLLWAVAAFSLLFLVLRIKVIAIDILITKAAARSVREVKWSILFPFFQLFRYVIFLVMIWTWFLFLSRYN